MEGITILNNDKGFDYWLNQDFISSETRTLLHTANVLIVPLLGFRDTSSPLFHKEIGDFIEYIKENPPKDIVVEVCIDNDNYKEISLCSDEIRLGEIIITSVAFPLAVNLLTEFIKYLLKKRRMNTDKANLEVTITISDKKQTKSFQYTGKAENFSKVFSQIKDLWEKK